MWGSRRGPHEYEEELERQDDYKSQVVKSAKRIL